MTDDDPRWHVDNQGGLRRRHGRRIGPAFGTNPKGTIAYMAVGTTISVIADADQPRLSGGHLSGPWKSGRGR